MSVTIEFNNPDVEEGGTLKVVVLYQYGDHEFRACHITCVVAARLYGNRMIRILEEKRLLGENNEQ